MNSWRLYTIIKNILCLSLYIFSQCYVGLVLRYAFRRWWSYGRIPFLTSTLQPLVGSQVRCLSVCVWAELSLPMHIFYYYYSQGQYVFKNYPYHSSIRNISETQLPTRKETLHHNLFLIIRASTLVSSLPSRFINSLTLTNNLIRTTESGVIGCPLPSLLLLGILLFDSPSLICLWAWNTAGWRGGGRSSGTELSSDKEIRW